MFKQMTGSNPESSIENSIEEEEDESDEEETNDLNEGPEDKIFGEFTSEVESVRQMKKLQKIIEKR